MVSFPFAHFAAASMVRKVYPGAGQLLGFVPQVATWKVRPAGSGVRRAGGAQSVQLPFAPAASAPREKGPATSPRVLPSACNCASLGHERGAQGTTQGCADAL